MSRSHPQIAGADGAFDGFDLDVTNELARRIHLSPEIRPTADIRTVPVGGAWDILMASMALARDRPTELRAVVATYYWPLYAVVRQASLTTAAELSGLRVGTTSRAAENWLSSAEPSIPTSLQPPSSGVLKTWYMTDVACFDGLARGEVDACITSSSGPADLAVRTSLRTTGGPVYLEPRGVLVALDHGEPSRLGDTITQAIDQMREEGFLADISRARFGLDLSVPSWP